MSRPTRPTFCSTSDKTRSENPLYPPPTQAPPPPSLITTSPPAATQSWAPPPTSPWKRTEGTLEVQFEFYLMVMFSRSEQMGLFSSFRSVSSVFQQQLEHWFYFFFSSLHRSPPQLLFSPLNAAVCWWETWTLGYLDAGGKLPVRWQIRGQLVSDNEAWTLPAALNIISNQHFNLPTNNFAS